MRNLFDGGATALRRVPVAAAGAGLAAGAVLADLHVTLLRHLHETGQQEWPQWVARVTLMTYWWLLPLCLLVIWAHRRQAHGRLGAAAAGLLAVGALSQVVITLATLVWGAALGRGDLPAGFMAVEAFGLLCYLGILVAGVAWLRDPELPRAWGALLIAGFVVDFMLTWAFTASYVVLAVLVVARSRRVEAAGAGVPALSAAE